MKKHLPNCPICQSETEYNIGSSLHIVQCNFCKAKFLSLDLKDPKKDLEELMLFELPTGVTDNTTTSTLNSLKHQKHPISFWQNFKIELPGRDTLKEGEILRLEKGWYAVKHGEKFEWSKSLFRFDLLRDLVLTEKAIYFMKDNKMDSEIPLDQISEVYPDVQALGNHYIRIKMKDGDGASIFFVCISYKMVFGALYGLGKQKALTDRWVNAINNQIRVNPH